MRPVRVFIDFPLAGSETFSGLAFPQVLHDFLVRKGDIRLVGEGEPFDILFVFNGASHYVGRNQSCWDRVRRRLPPFLHPRKIDYGRLEQPNAYYEKRVTRLLRENPRARLILRLDDRYRMLCKCYGFDATVEWLAERADAVVFQSEYCRSLFLEGCRTVFGPLRPVAVRNGVLIHNGVDRSIFSEEGSRLDLPGRYRILHVAATGMIRKGLGTVLEIAYLLRHNQDVQFFLVGNQQTDPIYGRDIGRFANVHKFDFTQDRRQLAEYFRSCSLLLFPSHNDCAPNVVLEAMSCGLPVVAANSGGTPELIIKADTAGGMLLDEKNPVYAVKETIAHLDLFRQQCRQLVDRYHTKEIVGERYYQLIKSLI